MFAGALVETTICQFVRSFHFVSCINFLGLLLSTFRSKNDDRIDALGDKLNIVENSLMMNVPRTHRMEKGIGDVSQCVDARDVRMHVIESRGLDNTHTHTSIAHWL